MDAEAEGEHVPGVEPDRGNAHFQRAGEVHDGGNDGGGGHTGCGRYCGRKCRVLPAC